MGKYLLLILSFLNCFEIMFLNYVNLQIDYGLLYF
jgi:hypothetical protein